MPNSPEKTLRRQYENASDTLFTEVRFFEAKEQKLLPESVHKGKNHSRILVFKDKDGHVEFEPSNRDDDENGFFFVLFSNLTLRFFSLNIFFLILKINNKIRLC